MNANTDLFPLIRNKYLECFKTFKCQYCTNQSCTFYTTLVNEHISNFLVDFIYDGQNRVAVATMVFNILLKLKRITYLLRIISACKENHIAKINEQISGTCILLKLKTRVITIRGLMNIQQHRKSAN